MPRFINPVPQYLNSAGDPIVSGEMYFYEIGSVTPKDTYLDAELTIPATNPVLLSADGRMPDTYLLGSYRTILSEPSSGEQWERDNVGSEFNEGFGAEWNSTITYNMPDVVLFDGNYYQSLTNNNAGNPPASSTGEWLLLNIDKTSGLKKLYSTSGTWTKPDGLKSIFVEVQGGGGGGGGASGAGSGCSSGGGGGGGGYSCKSIDANLLPASRSFIVGAGGLAGTTTSIGGGGGSTTFGAFLSGGGGSGGGTDLLREVSSTRGPAGGAGGAGGSGNLNIAGQKGYFGVCFNTSGFGGSGGGSVLGLGGGQSTNGAGGLPGLVGGGGSGGCETGATGRPGAPGGGGLIVITEFF